MENKYLYNFSKYVSANIIGALGTSLYIFADTYFMSYYAGPMGLTALNIAMPIYGIIFALAYMIAVGGGINFAYSLGKKDYNKGNEYFSISISNGLLVGTFLGLLGFIFSKEISIFLGANSESLEMTNTYIKTLISFSPFFILNTIIVTFLKYDNNPKLAMIASLAGSLFNVVGDYVFMEYFHLSVFGAALATGMSPIVSILISLGHFRKKSCTLKFKGLILKFKETKNIAKLGVSTSVYEISQALVTLAFNYIILDIAGNIGIAAYGIITNIGAIVMSLFNGMQQGMQPLISRAHGVKDIRGEKIYLKYGVIFGILLSASVYLTSVLNLDTLIGIFNSQNVDSLYQFAKTGILIYFLGFLPHGLNIAVIAYENAGNNPKISSILSLARGTVLSLIFALVLSRFYGMTGVWLSFLLAEVATLVLYGLLKKSES